MDLMDMSNKRGHHGYAMVAVDTATRQVYGQLMRNKTVDNIIHSFSALIGHVEGEDEPTQKPQVPQVIDMDQEAGWTRAAAFREFLQRKGIHQRFKTDQLSPNSPSPSS